MTTNKLIKTLGSATLLSLSASAVNAADQCSTVRFSDVGWTDIAATAKYSDQRGNCIR